MSYIAIYREFRPKKFEEVVGQEHVTDTLRRQVQNERVAHAYLFSGGRGSGKTSTAKILSRAVNCLHPVNGEPCNECEICKSALEGALTDITEIDAASNNGVDNIRDIREEVEFMPTSAKYRVYIIDEVHMLSTGAFNALLKTLEEPPSHVIFILATTEPQKLPVTILSRCQRFDFKKISINDISITLKKCAEKIGVEVDDGAIKLISRMADGALRDAYSILDRCIANGENRITEPKVRELIGMPAFEYLHTFLNLILNNQTSELIEFMEKIIAEGKNVDVFLDEAIKFIRDVLVLKTAGVIEGFSEDEKNIMMGVANSCDTQKLIYIITNLATVQGNMKWSSDSEVAFETGVLKVAIESNQSNINITAERVKPAITSTSSAPTVNTQIQPITDSLKNQVLTKLKENGKMRVYAVLQNAQIVKADDGLIHIEFLNSIDDTSKQYLQHDETKRMLKEAIVAVTQQDYKVKYVFQK